MNKEQAIDAIDTLAVMTTQQGLQFVEKFDAIEILRALPDDSPTVLTREKLDETIDGASKRKFPIWWAGQQFADGVWAMVQLRDALLALGPVAVEGPVECPTNHQWLGAELFDIDEANRPMETSVRMWFCPDCGTRLQGGE